MNSPEVPRVSVDDLTIDRFVTEYIQKNTPVVVTGALAGWNLDDNWTPEALKRIFGGKTVQVYNDYFALQRLMPLQRYFDEQFNQSADSSRKIFPYVRWYTQFRDAKFVWADDAFVQMRSNWRMPSFLPQSDYVLPWVSRGEDANPAIVPYPAKGLFISPRGGRTGLHFDPWGSCAALCQLYGRKQWYFYSPQLSGKLQNGDAIVDVSNPDRAKFPDFDGVRPTAQSILEPGEVMYVPHGWFHHVESLTDAISMTWNFVHKTTASAMEAWLREQPLSAFDKSVLQFFYKFGAENDVKESMLRLIRN